MGRTAGVKTTLAVEVAFRGPGKFLKTVKNPSGRRKVTVQLPVFGACIEDAQVASQNPTSMSVIRFTPARYNRLGDTVEQDVKEPYGVDPDLWEDVSLCGSGE